MVRADLEGLFYLWLLNKFCRLVRRVLRAAQEPKVRAALSLFFYVAWFLTYIMLMGWLIRSPLRHLLSDARGEREWERFKRMAEELSRHNERFQAVRGKLG